MTILATSLALLLVILKTAALYHMLFYPQVYKVLPEQIVQNSIYEMIFDITIMTSVYTLLMYTVLYK